MTHSAITKCSDPPCGGQVAKPMTDYDLIAPFYDIEHAHFDEDVSMYINFAELCGGPLLEFACGSGRLLVPLACEGYELTGVDSSRSMLNLAQHALEQA